MLHFSNSLLRLNRELVRKTHLELLRYPPVQIGAKSLMLIYKEWVS
jgi:hypothetical protein